jgi:predicted transposase/invertase (TIGR01784 family)
LQPVYSLNIVNENFESKLENFIHHYKIVHTQDSDHVIEGLEFVFIELPKFKAKKLSDKKLEVLWLRFLSEIEDHQEVISQDFLGVPEIKEASELILESGYSKAELETYDKYWDYVSTEKTIIADSYNEGLNNGLEEGLEKGLKRGMEKGLEKGKIEIAKKLLLLGTAMDLIIKSTGLSEKEIKNLRD